jgi:hypothetical protein
MILDASGSMHGRLADGTPKIVAAKSAVARLVAGMPADMNIGFRAYGHQSPRSQKNCRDTAMLVPFGAAAANGDAIVAGSQGLTAQGYTPITHVLGLAADDLKGEPGTRTIVLVSDGKETCEGDPCATARKLAEADAGLAIHTVGFGVDYQARTQLQCIARVARGTYRDAGSEGDLFESMAEAVKAEVETETETLVIQTPKDETGMLEIVDPYFNEVVDAETGEEVAKVTEGTNPVTLPPGIYNVQFGKNLWMKSVHVAGGETTVLKPGRLAIERPYFNEVLDPETGEEVEKATEGHAEFPLPAGVYDVAFGAALWRGIEVREGETTRLEPGRLAFTHTYYNRVLDPETGLELEKATEGHADFPLPPGTYDIRFGEFVWTGIEVREGETTTVDPARIEIERPGGNFFYRLETASGEFVIKLTEGTNDIPVPPGDYVLDVDGQKVALNLKGGVKKVLRIE